MLEPHKVDCTQIYHRGNYLVVFVRVGVVHEGITHRLTDIKRSFVLFQQKGAMHSQQRDALVIPACIIITGDAPALVRALHANSM